MVPADVLEEQWRASAAAAASYSGVDGVAELRRAAEARTRRLGDAVERAGGTVPGRTLTARSERVEDVLAAERRALEVHVAGVGQLGAREYRSLLAGVIAGSAAAESALLERLDRPPAP
ncbi:MAG TPA: hypothetical protein VFG79_13535, partial [Solirubrobacter sp.]|nr:hypothetical protein [Solirubrobacter sp.]